MLKNSKKNISRHMRDIRPASKPPAVFPIDDPQDEIEKQGEISPKLEYRSDLTLPRYAVVGFVVTFIAIAGVVILFGLYRLSQRPTTSQVGSLGLKDFLSHIQPLLQGGSSVAKNFGDTARVGLEMMSEARFLAQHALDFALSNKGDSIVASLQKIESGIAHLEQNVGELPASSFPFSGFSDQINANLPMRVELDRIDHFLTALIDWLKGQQTRHILIFLQNSSEMRPTGGFWGGYFEVAVHRANIKDIRFHDINDVDRTFASNIVPPRPLQVVERRWHIADANWFFDFSDSAEKVMSFMEASGLYKDRAITFDAAISVSPKAISDLLALTGPITIPSSSVTIDKDNFIYKIQDEVQAGQRQKQSQPKKVLDELEPLLVQNLRTLDENKQSKLTSLIQEWISNKDMMFYFRNEDLERFFDTTAYGSGKVFDLPSTFNGDYFAVVNSTIGGGKSDAFIRQSILFQTHIETDGTINDHVIIRRQHSATAAAQWWYRVGNQDYMRIFTPPGSSLINILGGDQVLFSSSNYKSLGYIVDPLVHAIESTRKENIDFPFMDTFQESGKNVFASWIKTAPGSTSELTLDYKNHLFFPPADGQIVEFVFEKQTGVQGEYQFEINAPIGYQWKENGLAAFEYSSKNPPGRLVLSLTLKKSH